MLVLMLQFVPPRVSFLFSSSSAFLCFLKNQKLAIIDLCFCCCFCFLGVEINIHIRTSRLERISDGVLHSLG